MTDERAPWSPSGGDPGEQVDMTVPRSSLAGAAASGPVCLLRLDDGSEHTVTGLTFVGRNPEAQPAGSPAKLIAVVDPLSSVSKTHAKFDVSGGVLSVSDCGSTNGTLVQSGGAEHPVAVDAWCGLAAGDRVMIGDRWFDVVTVPSTSPTPVTPAAPAVIASAPSTPSTPAVESAWAPGPIVAPPPDSPPATAPVIAGTCHNCGAALEADALFCVTCGTKVDTPVYGSPPPGGPSPMASDPWAARPVEPAAAEVGVPADAASAKSKTPMFIAAGVVGALVIAAGAWFVLGGDGGGGGGASGLIAIGGEPAERYAADVDIPEFGFVSVDGTPSRLFVGASNGFTGDGLVSSAPSTDAESTVSALDGEGAVSWEVDLDGSLGSITAEGDVVLVSSTDFDGDPTLVRLDQGSGDEIWSTDLDGDESWQLRDGRLYVYSDSSIALISLADGSSEERLKVNDGYSAMSAYLRSGVFVDWDVEDEEAQAFGPTFDELTSVIDVGEAVTVAYGGGTLVAAEGDELRGYDSAGEEAFTLSASLDSIQTVAALGGNRWVVSDFEETEVLQAGDGNGESLWSEDGSFDSVLAGSGYSVVVVADSDDYLFLDSATGDQIDKQDYAGFYFPAANGYFYSNDQKLEAVRLPSAEVAWSADSDDGYVQPLSGGYVIVETSEDEVSLTVFEG